MGLEHCPGLKQVYFMDLDMMGFRFSLFTKRAE